MPHQPADDRGVDKQLALEVQADAADNDLNAQEVNRLKRRILRLEKTVNETEVELARALKRPTQCARHLENAV